MARADLAACRAELDPPAAGADLGDLATRRHPGAALAKLVRQRPRYPGEVHDPGPRRVQRPEAASVRLELADPVRVHAPEAGHRVGDAPPLELVEGGQLGAVGCNDQLAAALVGDPVALAALVQEPGALHAQPGLE